MCGIAGILTRGRATATSRAAWRRCSRPCGIAVPTTSGTWQSRRRDSAAFAHTRLAVLDLTPAGHQPMSMRATAG